MRYRRAVRCCLLIAAAGLLACSTTQQQNCNPTSTKSDCDPGEKCAVAVNGRPTCYADDGGGTAEGESCAAADECAVGLGCVETFGVSRCLRFCDPDEAGGADDPCYATAGDDRINSLARCVARLPSQTQIGICVPPCDLANGDGCPAKDAVRCLLPLGVPYAMCGRVLGQGTAGAGEACGATRPCGTGVCMRRGNGAVCRESASSCSSGSRSVVVPDSTDPLADAEYQVCEPCAVLGQLGERWNQVCFMLAAGVTDAASLCSGDAAGLLRIESTEDAAKLLEQYRAVGETPWFDGIGESLEPGEVVSGTPIGFWTRAVRDDAGDWIWFGSEDPVDDALWADNEPSVDGVGAQFGIDGRLTAVAADALGFPMCTLGPSARAIVDLGGAGE